MIPRADLLSGLRADAPGAVLAVLFIAIGLATIALYNLRRRIKDPALLWFGLFELLYGVRLLGQQGMVRFTLGLDEQSWLYLQAALTYTMPLPAMLFCRELFPLWRPALRWLIRIQIAFAVIALIAGFALGRPGAAEPVNNVLVLLVTAQFLWALYRMPADVDTRPLRLGVIALVITIVLNNLVSLRLLPLTFNWEPLGFAFLLASLGRVTALRAFEREERLVEIEKELEIARRIQQSILPREMPTSDRLTVAARYLPMTAVAGDFYDFLILDQHRIGILIADVSGHGVPAALIASMVKVAIAAQLPHASEPAQVLTGMNQTLCGKLQGQFVTAAYLFLDLEAGLMRYGAASHPPMLWWHSSEQRIEPVEENGMILGLFARAPYTAVERPIAPGDRFLLYTDGLIEATNGTDEFYGADRLQQSFTPASSVDTIIASLSQWSNRVGPLQEDDLTILTIHLS